ncbi:hypothetical protein [Hyphomicrobium facile]|uniref:Lipoprotein n=1 Tax=Hyphomicrobium facile TaxID=51670 RepID=A0A1I7MXG3_9HYPH|nr:hypothetical protein [Hyphomicrobium facile]SFV27102.1 hypothetical protein SAMN04488557_0678 [Hyphomicrobium facile]
MFWASRKPAALLPIAICCLLAGCFEIDTAANFNEKGEANLKLEFAISAELMAIAANPNFQKDGQSPIDMMNKCGEAIPDTERPKGVKSVKSTPGQRSGMFTCTLEVELSDPVAAFASLKERQPDGPTLSIEKLPSADAYRIAATLTPSKDSPFNSDKPEDQIASSIATAMFANRFISIAISGLRIENHNGEGVPDQTKAIWKIPLLGLIGPGASRPFQVQADVIYSEPWYIKLKRKFLG